MTDCSVQLFVILASDEEMRERSPHLDVLGTLRNIAPDCPLDDGGGMSTFDGKRWPSIDEDMKNLSRLFFDFIFAIYYHEYDVNTEWVTYYRRGRMATDRPVLVYPTYKELGL